MGEFEDWYPSAGEVSLHDFTVAHYFKKKERMSMGQDWDFPVEKRVNSDVEAEVAARLRERQIEAEVEKRLRLVAAYGKDNFPVGAVIRFRKQFKPDGKLYAYAAIKCEDGWYTSGPRTPKGYSWDELVAWLVSAVPVTNIEKMVPANAESEVREQVAKEDNNVKGYPAND
jgi:hypothetical protein